MNKRKLILILAVVLCSFVVGTSAYGQHVITRKPVVRKQDAEKKTPVKKQSSNNKKIKPKEKEGAPVVVDERPKAPQIDMTAIDNLISNMVYVEGGTFTMGATAEQGSDAGDMEKPPHQVTVSSFYICKYEVTQRLWQVVMGSNPSNYKIDDFPVETVSWFDCQEFITKLNNITGKQFRLPTEAEWEFAARGGNKSKGYKYSGSNYIDDVAWYLDYSLSNHHAVGSKKPNELGLYDMSGSVWEYCQDWYGGYPSAAQTNPRGAEQGSYRVQRGGSWNDKPEGCRVSKRGLANPSLSFSHVGLRLAM